MVFVSSIIVCLCCKGCTILLTDAKKKNNGDPDENASRDLNYKAPRWNDLALKLNVASGVQVLPATPTFTLNQPARSDSAILFVKSCTMKSLRNFKADL
jgi:hypothetical protein